MLARIKAINFKGAAFATAVMVALLFFYIVIQTRYFPSTSISAVKGNALIAGVMYPSENRSKVVVTEINDDYLKNRQEQWPPTYSTYSAILNDIAILKPQSIFLDVALRYRREGGNPAGLANTLCEIQQRGIRIYLAGLEDDSGVLRFIPELEAVRDRCFTPAGIRYEPDSVTTLALSYPVLGNGDPDPSASAEVQARRSQIPSAAWAMARDARPGLALQAPQSMALVWGLDAHPSNEPAVWNYCRAYSSKWTELVPPVLRQLWQGNKAFAPPCPFHNLAPLDYISDPRDDQIAKDIQAMVEGHHVLIGATVSGVNDVAISPVQGRIPGVYIHAMALDNLLTYGMHFKREHPLHKEKWWLFCLVALAVGLISYAGGQGAKWLLGQYQPPSGDAAPAATTSPGRLDWRAIARNLKAALGEWGHKSATKALEVMGSLLITAGGFYLLQHHTTASIEDFAQLVGVMLALQWTEVTQKTIHRAKVIVGMSPPEKKESLKK